VVQLRLRAVYRRILVLGVNLEVRKRSSMIHWDWVLTLITAVFTIKTAELFVRAVMDMLFDVVYPYMRSFTKTVVATQFPQATGLVDELLPDEPVKPVVPVQQETNRCTMNPNSCKVSYCDWPRCTEPGLR
jgi:hypothetical protein